MPAIFLHCIIGFLVTAAVTVTVLIMALEPGALRLRSPDSLSLSLIRSWSRLSQVYSVYGPRPAAVHV